MTVMTIGSGAQDPLDALLASLYGYDWWAKLVPEAERPAAERALKEAMAKLDERGWDIVTAYFGFGRDKETLQEIGNRYTRTREAIRQSKDKALARLRRAAKDGTLDELMRAWGRL